MQPVHGAGFDFNLLVAFDALFAERNVTRAAHRVGLSQSAMSHALARLRLEVGDELFTATPRGMVPTPLALRLEKPLREAVALVRRTLEKPTPFDPLATKQSFSMAATDFCALIVLPALLVDLQRRAPGIDLRIMHTSVSSIDELARGERDLVIAIGWDTPPHLRSAALIDDHFVCIRRKPRRGVLPKLTLARYLATPHILVSPLGQGDAPVDIALRKIGKKRRIVLRLPHFLVAPLLLAQTDYVMTVPTRLATVFSELLSLQIDPPPVPIDGFTMVMLWHERADDDPTHMFLRERIVAAARLPKA